jgi:type IV pilus assembly protein PilP
VKRHETPDIVIYSLVAVLCVGSAFLISLKFLGKSHAQETELSEAAAAAATTAGGQAPAQPATGTPPPAGASVPAAPTPPPADGAGKPQAGGPPGAPPAPGQPAKSNTGSELSELEGFLEPFIYDVVNRRDPFLVYAEYVPVDVTAPTRPMSPAQRFDLDQLHLVGIMWDVKDPKAMFMDPEAEVIVLGRDEGIGNRNGYIAAIREGEVVVVEAIRKRGDIIYKTRVLRIER